MSTFGGKEDLSRWLTFFLLVITFMQRNVILSVSGLSIILQIMSEYKIIVLQKGLEDEAVDEYQFRKIKSLLRKELKLTKKMQDDYDKIQIADLMEDKFPKDAGLDKLTELCQSIKELEDLAQRLKTEKAKVESQKEGQNETAVEKEKDEEPSSSHSLSTNNELSKHKPSAEKKRKQTIKPEGGKKKKLTEEQIWHSEPSGSNREKDEGCLQTPPKPPPTLSSSSSSKKRKNTSNKNISTTETETIEKKHKLLEFSTTSNTSAVSQLQAPLVLSATISSNVPCMPSEAVSGSVQAPQMSPASVSSCAQNILRHTPVAFSSMQALHSPQVPAFRSDQATRRLSVTLKSKAQVRMMPPTTASINMQIPHAVPEAVPRNDCSIQMSQTATPSGIQTLNSATVKAPTDAKVPGLLETGSTYFLARLVSPATASSSLQASQVLLPTTSNTHPAPQVSIPKVTSSVQTTQTHPGAVSTFLHVLHAPPLTESRSVYTTQVPQGVASSIGQALPCPKVKASTSVHAPQKPSATASKGLPAPCASSPPTISSSLLDSRVCPATALRALQVPLMPPASTSTSPSRVINARRKVTQP